MHPGSPCSIPGLNVHRGAIADGVSLYNIKDDPLELTELSQSNPSKVKELLARMAVYGKSADQVPPTIFWPYDGQEQRFDGKDGVAAWDYQCPQCKHSGALPSAASCLLDGKACPNHWDPWCDDVECGVGPPAPAPPPPPPPPPLPPVAPTPGCPVVWRGGLSNPDLWEGRVASWPACCARCGNSTMSGTCKAWTWFEDGACHLHSSDAGKNTNRHPLPVSGTMRALPDAYEWFGFDGPQ